MAHDRPPQNNDHPGGLGGPRLRTGVVGAVGFAGTEFLRLAAQHPGIDVVWLAGDSTVGERVSDIVPSLRSVWPDTRVVAFDDALLDGVELVVTALPHGASQSLMPRLDSVPYVVDLAADFRHPDPSVYPEWYDEPHAAPDLLDRFAYGIPELYRDRITGSRRVAAPGCYPTSAILAMQPLVAAGLVDRRRVIVDAACGVSGAGRPPKPNTTFCTVDENFTAYGLLRHRHTPEMQTHIGADVIFTPHLLPANRGILATCYGDPVGHVTSSDALDALSAAYDDEPFVVVDEAIPATKSVLGSNCVHITARVDERTRTVIAIAALDNLTKGTAGGAIQCINLMSGWPEATALPLVGVAP